MSALRIAAATEAVSLAVLLVNLFTVHTRPITALVGPVHGTAYLVVIATTLLVPAASTKAKWCAFVPGVGGVLALRHIGARTDRVE